MTYRKDMNDNDERTDEEMFREFWRYAKLKSPALRLEFLKAWIKEE